MPVITGRVDDTGQSFTPDGSTSSVNVIYSPPQTGATLKQVDLGAYAGSRIAIVYHYDGDNEISGTQEVGRLEPAAPISGA